MSIRFKGFHGSTVKVPVRGKKGKPTVQKVQKQITNIKKKLKKEPMIKVFDSDISGTFSNAGAISQINPTDVANSVSNGITLEGVQARMTSLYIKGWMKSAGATTVPARIDVVLDREPTPGTIATYDGIYYPLIANVTVNAMVHPLHRHRFKILASFRASPVTNDEQCFLFERMIKLNHKITTNTANSFDIDNLDRNAILIVRWCDAAANQPTYSMNYQLVCVDDN